MLLFYFISSLSIAAATVAIHVRISALGEPYSDRVAHIYFKFETFSSGSLSMVAPSLLLRVQFTIVFRCTQIIDVLIF